MPWVPLKLHHSKISMIPFNFLKQHYSKNGKIKLAAPNKRFPELLFSLHSVFVSVSHRGTKPLPWSPSLVLHLVTAEGSLGLRDEDKAQLRAPTSHRSKYPNLMQDDSSSKHQSPSGCASCPTFFSPPFSLFPPKFPNTHPYRKHPATLWTSPSQAFLFQLPDCQPQHSRAAHLQNSAL